MPKIYVAYRTSEVDETVKKKKQPPERMVSGSETALKKRLRDWKTSEWTVAFYNFKPDVKTICVIMEDLSDLEAEKVESYRVNDSGQVRKTS